MAWILCIAIAVVLLLVVREDRKENAEHIAQLQKQAEELEQTDGEKLETLTDIYDKFYSQVSIPSMVCWGDSAMAGSKYRSLAISLNKVIEENLFSALSKSLSRVLEKGEYTTPSTTIHNMGVTNETMRHILIRAGVNSMELGDWIQIPASTDPVTVRLMDEEAWNSEEKEAQIRLQGKKT